MVSSYKQKQPPHTSTPQLPNEFIIWIFTINSRNHVSYAKPEETIRYHVPVEAYHIQYLHSNPLMNFILELTR